MNKILIIAATSIEIEPLINNCPANVDLLITGIGSASSILETCIKLSKNNYKLLINIGIAGSYHSKFEIGQVVQVVHDEFGDLGFEDANTFIPIQKTKWYSVPKNINNIYSLADDFELIKVNGLTVNRTAGCESTILERKSIFNADVETMESAAFFMISEKFSIPLLSLRAISNQVEVRNIELWNIPFAVAELHQTLRKILNTIQL